MAPFRYIPYVPESNIQVKKVSYVSICRDSFCRSAVKKGSQWCLNHACRVPLCTEPENCPLHVCRTSYCRQLKRSNTSNLCKLHRCVLCDNSADDCSQHVCMDKHCRRLRVKGSIWCELCKCLVQGCFENKRCKTHVCQKTGSFGGVCSSLSVENSLFCFEHKCGRDGCRKVATECKEHRCLHCSRLAIKGQYCRYDGCPESTCFQSRKCPQHVCNGCWNRKRCGDSSFCTLCKCRWCNAHHSCPIHKCISCKKVAYTLEESKICTDCSCEIWGCLNVGIHDKKCYIHAYRCIECEDVAVVRGVYCKKHSRCKICFHKPRLPMSSTCGRHHKAIAPVAAHYPPIVEKKRTLFDVVRLMLYEANNQLAFHKLSTDVLNTIEKFLYARP